MDEKYRIPLILFYFQELSYQQIADVLNITLATVKTRIFRAKDSLKKEMGMNGRGTAWTMTILKNGWSF